MFGLMRAKKCGMSADEKHFRRLHYCGTCKTIGSLYGQKLRLLLNHDTVFLSEILTSLSGENVSDWQNSYQSYNCFSLPTSEMPLSLQFAATANIILSEFKIADHIHDSRQSRFKFAYRIFSKDFLKAEQLLKTWNFPLEQVRETLQTQEKREAENSTLESFAEPTAQTTALFFAHGVELIGKRELKNLGSEIGFAFGKLIYLLDAFEDFEKDIKTNEFNAIKSAFDLTGNKISASTARKVTTILRELESEIISKINQLPIDDRQKQIFASRLQSNLNKKLPTELPVLICKPKKRLTISERFQRAKIRAKELTANHSWATVLPVFIFILAFAFISPIHAKEAKSSRECFDLSFNLMFLGAIFGSVFASVKSFSMENPEELLTKKGRRKKMAKTAAGNGSGDSEGWCGWCDCCDCGDGCDCCCDGCCDNCDCCDCSCDC